MYKCPKCSFKGTFKQVRAHHKAQHSKKTLTKSQSKTVYTYKVPKGFGKGGRRK